MNICVLIPIYNEANSIAPLVRAVIRQGFKVIVVDDGCTDGSGDLAKNEGAIVIRHEQKTGKGFSLRDGIQNILKQTYDGVIMMDGDGQHDPEELPKFVDYAQHHQAQFINGNRMNNASGMPFTRFITNWVMSALISLYCRQRVADTQCGYRYVSRKILAKVPFRCNDFEIESEMIMRSARAGYVIHSLPVKTIYQFEESKIHPLKDTIRFIKFFGKAIFHIE